MRRLILTMIAVVAVLAAAGTVAAQSAQRFPDVAPDHEAYEAVEWAAGVGITLGYTDGTFKPERPLHKNHAVLFMERYYDEILQASESPDFTRGDMMRLLKAINDGGSVRPVTPTTGGSSGSFSGLGRTVTDVVQLSGGLHRVTFAVSGNTYGSAGQFSGAIRLDAINDEGQRVADQVRTTGASGTWQVLVRLDEPTLIVFQIGGLEPHASWSISYEALTGADDQQPDDSASAPDAPDAPPLPSSGGDWETSDTSAVFYAIADAYITDDEWGDTRISVLVGCSRPDELYAKFSVDYAALAGKGQVSYQFGGQQDAVTVAGTAPSVRLSHQGVVELRQRRSASRPQLDRFIRDLRADTSGTLTFHLWDAVDGNQALKGGGTLHVRGVAQAIEPVLERCKY